MLKGSGLLECYTDLMKTLCTEGLPDGNIYEFSADQIMKFEKKMKA